MWHPEEMLERNYNWFMGEMKKCTRIINTTNDFELKDHARDRLSYLINKADFEEKEQNRVLNEIEKERFKQIYEIFLKKRIK